MPVLWCVLSAVGCADVLACFVYLVWLVRLVRWRVGVLVYGVFVCGRCLGVLVWWFECCVVVLVCWCVGVLSCWCGSSEGVGVTVGMDCGGVRWIATSCGGVVELRCAAMHFVELCYDTDPLQACANTRTLKTTVASWRAPPSILARFSNQLETHTSQDARGSVLCK